MHSFGRISIPNIIVFLDCRRHTAGYNYNVYTGHVVRWEFIVATLSCGSLTDFFRVCVFAKHLVLRHVSHQATGD